jgi:ketosteroid isomerase-like protein
MASNTETARAVYDSFATGDVPSLLAAFDEKIDWQEPDGLPFEDQVGPRAVVDNVFGAVLGQLQDFRVDVRELVEGGDIVCAIGTYHGVGASNGVELDAEFVHVLRFGSNGKITGFTTYTDTYLWRQSLGL